MRVRFSKPWFGPGEHLRQPTKPHTVIVPGHLYAKTQKHEPAVELPDEFRALLHPSFATIVDANDQPEALAAEAPKTLADFDLARHGLDTVEALVDRAEAGRVAGTRKPPRS